MLVINTPTCSATGMPVANCGCGGHGRKQSNAEPAHAPQTPLGIPVMDFAANVEEEDSYSEPQADIIRNDRSASGGECLGIPTLNFAPAPPSRSQQRSGKARQDGKETPLGIPTCWDF